MRDRTVLVGVQVSPLLGLEELRADGDGRRPPSQTSHHVSGTRLVLAPTRGQQFIRKIFAAATRRDGSEPAQRQLRGPSGDVEVLRLEGARYRGLPEFDDA